MIFPAVLSLLSSDRKCGAVSKRSFVIFLLVSSLVLESAGVLSAAEPAVLAPEKLAAMDGAVAAALADGALPGGVLWVEHNGSQYHKAYGKRALKPEPEEISEDTIYDAASLTKVLATAPALMILWERGLVKFDDSVVTYIPEFRARGKQGVTIRHLLTHTSGLAAGLGGGRGWSGYDGAIAAACQEGVSHPPGTFFRYSDINFIVLGDIVRRVAGVPLDEVAAKELYRPLKMVDTGYLPPASKLPRIAPTERIGKEVLRGRVHDPTAQRMGGVAGHAGVFTTAADLARFCRMMLNQGELEGVRVLRAETVKVMTSVQSPPEVKARRGFGWDIDSDYSRPRGNVFPIGSFGHTGFTGVCLWIDPFSHSFWLFLSNRVHPDRSTSIGPLQRTLATLSAEAVADFDFRSVPGALSPRQTNVEPGSVRGRKL